MSSRITSTSLNCARNFRQAGTGASAASSLRPWRSSRARAFGFTQSALRVRPQRGEHRLNRLLIRAHLVFLNCSAAHTLSCPWETWFEPPDISTEECSLEAPLNGTRQVGNIPEAAGVRRSPAPEGASDTSPMFQHWVWPHRKKSPAGTAERQRPIGLGFLPPGRGVDGASNLCRYQWALARWPSAHGSGQLFQQFSAARGSRDCRSRQPPGTTHAIN